MLEAVTRSGVEETGQLSRRVKRPAVRCSVTAATRERFERWPSLPYLRDHYGYEELSFAPGLLRTFSPRDFDLTVTCGYPYTNWVLRWRRHGQRPRHVFVTQNGDAVNLMTANLVVRPLEQDLSLVLVWDRDELA